MYFLCWYVFFFVWVNWIKFKGNVYCVCDGEDVVVVIVVLVWCIVMDDFLFVFFEFRVEDVLKLGECEVGVVFEVGDRVVWMYWVYVSDGLFCGLYNY